MGWGEGGRGGMQLYHPGEEKGKAQLPRKETAEPESIDL